MVACVEMNKAAQAIRKNQTLNLRVLERRREAVDVWLYRLERPGQTLPAWKAGAHIDITTPCGLKRQYSLCGDPAQNRFWDIAVRLAPDSRGGSRSIHESIVPGTMLSASLPRHSFGVQEGTGGGLLLAAGIGLTPLFSMAWHLHHEQRPFVLHYFASSRQRAPLVNALQDAPFHGRVHVHIGLPRSQIDDVIGQAMEQEPNRTIYTCGPLGFMEQIERLRQEHGGDAPLFKEQFVPAVESTSEGDQAFTVRLGRRASQEIPVQAHQSILEALELHNIVVDSSCRQGTCGSCIQTVLDGQVIHRDSCLSASEQGQEHLICLCVSRSAGPILTLDL